MSALLDNVKAATVDALVARMSAADRYALARRLVAEMPKDDRERLLVHSPGFVRFARAFLLFAGGQRPTG
jgi:hypothetical protein